MLVVDVEATVAQSGWKAATAGGGTLVDVDNDVETVELGMFADGSVAPGLCVASWRWDLDHKADGRRLSARNVHTVIRKAQKVGFRFLAIDCLSVHQLSAPEVFRRNLVEFSELYSNPQAPVVTAYGTLSRAGTPALSRAWISSELATFGSRAPLGQVLDVGGWGPYGPNGLLKIYLAVAKSSGDLKNLGPGYFLWYPFLGMGALISLVAQLAGAALGIPFAMLGDALFLMRWGRFRGYEMKDEATEERAEAWAVKLLAPIRWLQSSLESGLIMAFFAVTWLTGLNALTTYFCLRSSYYISPLTQQKVILWKTTLSNMAPALYFGDCMHIVAKSTNEQVLSTGLRCNEDAFGVLQHFAVLAYGNTLSIGHATCAECRLRAAFVFTVIVAASAHLNDEDKAGKMCFTLAPVDVEPSDLLSVSTLETTAESIDNLVFLMATRRKLHKLAKKRANDTGAAPGAVLLATRGNRFTGSEVMLDLVGIPGVKFTKYTTEMFKLQLLACVTTDAQVVTANPNGSYTNVMGADGLPLVQRTTLSVAETYKHLLGTAMDTMRSCHCCNGAPKPEAPEPEETSTHVSVPVM